MKKIRFIILFLCFAIIPISTLAQDQTRNRFYIFGAVRRPGIYAIDGKASILKLITLAGGLSDQYGQTAIIIRETGDSLGYKLIQLNISDILKGKLDQNIYLEPDDVVFIPAEQVVYLTGEIKSPGRIRFGKGLTLRQAILFAGGLTNPANAQPCIIYREDPVSGKHIKIEADARAIVNGESEDLKLEPNDIVSVGKKDVFRKLTLPLPLPSIDTPPLRGLPEMKKPPRKETNGM